MRGWAPKGETPVSAVNAQARYGQAVLNIAFNVCGQSYFRIQDTEITAADFRDFLQGLRGEFPGCLLFAICDNTPIQKAKEIKEWIEADGLMKLGFLLPDAPQLNPAEIFNTEVCCPNGDAERQGRDQRACRGLYRSESGKRCRSFLRSASSTSILDTPK